MRDIARELSHSDHQADALGRRSTAPTHTAGSTHGGQPGSTGRRTLWPYPFSGCCAGCGTRSPRRVGSEHLYLPRTPCPSRPVCGDRCRAEFPARLFWALGAQNTPQCTGAPSVAVRFPRGAFERSTSPTSSHRGRPSPRLCVFVTVVGLSDSFQFGQQPSELLLRLLQDLEEQLSVRVA